MEPSPPPPLEPAPCRFRAYLPSPILSRLYRLAVRSLHSDFGVLWLRPSLQKAFARLLTPCPLGTVSRSSPKAIRTSFVGTVGARRSRSRDQHASSVPSQQTAFTYLSRMKTHGEVIPHLEQVEVVGLCVLVSHDDHEPVRNLPFLRRVDERLRDPLDQLLPGNLDSAAAATDNRNIDLPELPLLAQGGPKTVEFANLADAVSNTALVRKSITRRIDGLTSFEALHDFGRPVALPPSSTSPESRPPQTTLRGSRRRDETRPASRRRQRLSDVQAHHEQRPGAHAF